MFQGISNTLSSLPLTGIACTAAGLFLGRNLIAAGAYKIASIGAEFISSKNAEPWNQTSKEYLTLAKKNGLRDLTATGATAGLIAIGVASGFAKGKTSKEDSPKDESGSLSNYAWSALKAGLIFGLGYRIGFCKGRKFRI
jgi:hypothetical protein